MFDIVKTVRLDDMGREVVEWHRDADIIEVVRAIEANYPHSLIEAKYTRFGPS